MGVDSSRTRFKTKKDLFEAFTFLKNDKNGCFKTDEKKAQSPCLSLPVCCSLLELVSGSVVLGISREGLVPCHPLPLLYVGKHGFCSSWFGCIVRASDWLWWSLGNKKEVWMASEVGKRRVCMGPTWRGRAHGGNPVRGRQWCVACPLCSGCFCLKRMIFQSGDGPLEVINGPVHATPQPATF